MSGNQFIPNFKPSTHTKVEHQPAPKEDLMSKLLHKLSRYAVLILLFLLPIFFAPGLWASLSFNKVMLSMAVVAVVVTLACFMALRKLRVKTVLPVSLGIFWLVVVTAFVSGFSSGDTLDSLRGSAFEVQTAGFLATLASVMTITLVLQNSKTITLKAISLFVMSASLVLLYSLARIFFGADFLSFGSFSSITVSPIGGFNDLGILSGMMVIFGLITLALLPLRLSLQSLVLVIILVALSLLGVINFFNIWVVVGFFALLMLLFLITRDTLFQSDSTLVGAESSRVLIFATTIVCIVSAVFVIGGDYAGNTVSKIVRVDYAEVVPSIEGTLGIARKVFDDDPLLGIGPNRFADAWRIHKDPVINQTVFWDTDFNAGNGFVLTLFVNLGLVGGALLIAFHLWFVYLGFRILSRNYVQDPYWYFVGAVSFSSAFFIWAMSYVYTPGAAILLLGAVFTGLTFVSASALLPKMNKSIPLVTNRRRGFFMMAIVIIIISNLCVSLLSVGKQYVAEASFTEAQATSPSVAEFEKVATDAFQMYPDDRFASLRAQIQLMNLNALLNVQNPTEEDQQRFLSIVEQAQIFVDQALSQDNTNPDNHAILAGVYSGLAVAGVSGAKERALAALEEATTLDPQNPGYHLIAAQMLARIGDIDLARSEITESLKLKPNYTEALFLSAQIDIKEGKTESAIVTTKSIITLEPRNPTRYFQLGMLLSSVQNYDEAVLALETAIRLDPQYANARYLLALAHLYSGKQSEALEQLQIVAVTNSENKELLNLIQKVESGDLNIAPELGLDTPVSEVSPAGNSVDYETSKRAEETDLISTINTISNPPERTEEVIPEEPLEEITTTLEETEPEVTE
ncbi:tetratricopeptide repeat protein [Candidatus Nomurabacteria bacterium]|nr:tetratricopeptide repeat protein [Candidatus Nomurabacteria bacterium]